MSGQQIRDELFPRMIILSFVALCLCLFMLQLGRVPSGSAAIPAVSAVLITPCETSEVLAVHHHNVIQDSGARYHYASRAALESSLCCKHLLRKRLLDDIPHCAVRKNGYNYK